MTLNENQNTSSRRTVVKGAAWSVPVIAAAIAAPAASASDPVVPPVFYDWSVGGSASVGSGNSAFFSVQGQSAAGEPATLPAGFTITITPSAGVVLEVNSSPGYDDVVVHPDGSITATVVAGWPVAPRINFVVTGPVGAKIEMVADGPYEPFVDSKTLTIRAG